MRTLGSEFRTDIIPKMDYVVCTKNDETTIQECLKSVLKQTNLDNLIIVHSANSTDNTLKIINNFWRAGHIPTLIIEKIGLTYAKKTVVKMIRTEYCVYLDADVILPSRWIEDIWSYMQDDVGALQAKTYNNETMLKYMKKRNDVVEEKERGMYCSTVMRRSLLKTWNPKRNMICWGDYSLTQHILKNNFKWLLVPVYVPHHESYRPAYFKGSAISVASARRAGYYKNMRHFLKTIITILLGGIKVAIVERNVEYLTQGVARFLGSIIGYFAWTANLKPRRW